MNQQNISKTPDLPVKRKRGRPRKDESMPRNVKQHTQPPLAMAPPPPAAMITTIHPPPAAFITSFQPPPPATVIPSSTNVNKVDTNMVGQAVTCVIDGIFDNGYLISTRLGPNNSILRGIVFQHGHVAPVTPANDVAPHLAMCTRGEYPIPPLNPRNPMQMCAPESVSAKQPPQPVTMQNSPAVVTGGSSSSAPQESLRLVEQDDVMQVFEASKEVEEPQDCDQRGGKNEQLISDPTAESYPERDTMVHDKATEHEPVVNASSNEQQPKEPDGEKPEVIAPVETVVENLPSMANDGLLQESQEQTGEVSNVNANHDANQEVAVDLSLSNFPEI